MGNVTVLELCMSNLESNMHAYETEFLKTPTGVGSGKENQMAIRTFEMFEMRLERKVDVSICFLCWHKNLVANIQLSVETILGLFGKVVKL